MGIFTVELGVGHPAGGDLAPVDAVVDTGAAHSMLPAALLDSLHVPPRRQLDFILADGSVVNYGYGIAQFRIADEELPCPVIFGPDGNYLLGASTLEVFNLMADPSDQRLVPVEWLRLGWGGAI